MKKRWVLKDQGNKDEIEKLAGELNIGTSLARLLMQRNIKTFDQAKEFFRPSLNDLHDPFLMKDMAIAIERIEQAIRNKESIMIYGDYDVDGTTSVSLVYSFLKDYYFNVHFYIPDRDVEGYGISVQGIDFSIEKGCSLIIALDCGIKAVDKIDYAKQRGVDFIICDHHYPGDELPKAVAILDPKREDCEYPYKDLSGCGVGFKLIQAYAHINGIPNEEVYPFLDLVAVSIASDIVPVTGENRVLAHFGLIQLGKNPRVGLRSILKIAGLESNEVSIEDIVFRVGPRINAAGRLESGKSAVELLVSKEVNAANRIAMEIDSCNNERKNIDRNITQEALRMISNDTNLRNRKTTVLFNPEWHKGVVGIVASRLIENYYRPTIVMTKSNGLATGSARSVVGFDLYKAIEACSDLLENFGGHMYAAGLSMKEENVPEFRERFEKYVTDNILPEQMIPQVEIDMMIDFEQITPKFYNILRQFKPYGPDNMSPVFCTQHVKDSGSGRIVGQSGEHMKLDLHQPEKSLVKFPAIAFQQAHNYHLIIENNSFDVCYNIEENSYRGNTYLQLNIKDLRENMD